MSFYRLVSNLNRSRSTGALDALDSKDIDAKVVDFFANYCSNDRNETPAGSAQLLDSLNASRAQILDLKDKNQKLRTVVGKLQNILKLVKEDSNISYKDVITNFLQESMKTMEEIGLNFEGNEYLDKPQNKQARDLLEAIAPKRLRLDVEVKDGIQTFEDKVQKNEIPNTLNAELKNPLLLKSISSVPISDSAWENYQLLNSLCDKFEPPKILWNFRDKYDLDSLEHKDFRHGKVEPKTCDPLSLETEYLYAAEANVPASPPQPADFGVSVIDHMMHLAVINKKISENDYNASFQEALSHCNLALVMSACRAVEPSRVFSPCALSQPVLLSLVQQLATDMLHETQLKCRYLEEALINLDVSDQVTRAHLPLVVEEVRKHLTKFVCAYPHHFANRRVSLIIMAANNLIK